MSKVQYSSSSLDNIPKFPFPNFFLTSTNYFHNNDSNRYLINPATFFQNLIEPLELTTTNNNNEPLDLSVKAAPITPPCTPSPNRKKVPNTVPANFPYFPKSPKFKKLSTNSAATTKVVRKLNFDEDKSSPVSGTMIRELGPDENLAVRKGDIDPAFNVVEITEEARNELAKIDNIIGKCKFE